MKSILLLLTIFLASCSITKPPYTQKDSSASSTRESSISSYSNNIPMNNISSVSYSSAGGQPWYTLDDRVFPGLAIDYFEGLEEDLMPGQIALRISKSGDRLGTIYFLTDLLKQEGHIYFGDCLESEVYTIVKSTQSQNLLIHEIDYPCEERIHPTYIVEREYEGKTEFIIVLIHKNYDVKKLEPYLFTLRTVE